jgi:hypothetical protein
MFRASTEQLTAKAVAAARGCLLAAALALVTALPASAEVIFQDGFESANLSARQNNVNWGESQSTSVSSERAMSGSYALKFTFQGVASGQDSWSEQRFYLGGNYPDVWVKYDLYVPSNYEHRQQSDSANNKGFLYLWSGDYNSPSGPGLGPNLWPVNAATGPASEASFYMWGPGWGRHNWTAMPKAIESADRGQWVTIVSHYKYASSANNDGVAEVWKTRGGVQQKIMSIMNGNWYVSGQRGFDQGYLLGWANSGFSQTTVFYIDNVVFSTTSLLGKVPNAPSSVSVE